jgi:HJR/Mrr/RecB family endonuclease
MGYRVIHTNLSKDQGADLIIEKFGERIVIQAKNWTNNVGNTGVQEIVAAIKHYNANKARVISSSGFTSAAIDLAETNKVELWDRNKIILLLNQYPIFSQ